MSLTKALFAHSLTLLAAFSSSTTLQLNNYTIGSGGGASHGSTYYVEGSAGELVSNNSASATYMTLPGSLSAQNANVPTAPTLSNNSGVYYNQLQLTLNTSNNPTDTLYSVAISTDGFVTTNYVQASGTIGSNPVYQTYAQWGGGSGVLITGLASSTTYSVKANAMQGNYTASAYGPAASSTTGAPTLLFSLSTNAVNLGMLSPGTPSSANGSASYATSANNGGYIYIMGRNGGLASTLAAATILSGSTNLNAGQGFGVVATGASQTRGGPLTALTPFNVSLPNVGAVTTNFQPIFTSASSITNASAQYSIAASSSATTPAASDYQETLTFIASASF